MLLNAPATRPRVTSVAFDLCLGSRKKEQFRRAGRCSASSAAQLERGLRSLSSTIGPWAIFVSQFGPSATDLAALANAGLEFVALSGKFESRERKREISVTVRVWLGRCGKRLASQHCFRRRQRHDALQFAISGRRTGRREGLVQPLALWRRSWRLSTRRCGRGLASLGLRRPTVSLVLLPSLSVLTTHSTLGN
jgi:hypothetical protein